MKVFVAGGSGVMGVRLLPLLVSAGHEVVAMTRTPGKLDLLRGLGAEPVLCDAYDGHRVAAAVAAARPEAVIHQLTDLPDDSAELALGLEGNARIREEGTDHLLAAARASGVDRVIVQSIAWLINGIRLPSVEYLERCTQEAGGVVLRYGQWYGDGTYHPNDPPPEPRIQIDAAARATVEALALEPGIYTVTDDGITATVDG